MTMTASPPLRFISEPPLRQARRFVDADLAGKATGTQLRWLHDHPILWLRALGQVKLDVNAHIAKDHADLAPLKPPSGMNPTTAYLAAKTAQAQRSTGRMHFMRILETRIAEVVTLCGSNRPVIVGDLVRVMAQIADLIADDDVQAAHDLARHYADRWLREARGDVR